MTPDQLRELADALEPMSSAPRFEGMNVLAFCKWLRAQAEAQPVGYATANGLRMLQQDDATVLLYKHDYLIRPDHVALYTYPAPAEPQADAQPVATLTLLDDMGVQIDFRKSFTLLPGQTFFLYSHPTATEPQAEPKREPLSDERIELPDYLRLQIASTAAAHDVLVERRRQVEVEGWTPEHDDAEHLPDELALAAASYICADEGDAPPAIWPWDRRWWKPSTPRRNLVKAGALILAEIERLDRIGGSDAE